jgi:hypothetical protein
MRKIALFAVVQLAGCGSDTFVEAATSVHEQAIRGGDADTDTPAVIGVLHEQDGGSELCSGFLIMPDLVVTARHCAAVSINSRKSCFEPDAASAPEPRPPELITIDTRAAVEFSEFVVIDEVILTDEPALCGNDFALLRLHDPLDIVPLIPRLDRAPVVGEAVSTVGYGSGATGEPAGIRRRRDGVTVSTVGEVRNDVSSFLDTVEGEWVVSAGPCGGDSGSPALDDDGAVIGIMSRGNQATCEGMIYERLDVHAAFFREHAIASATRLGIDAPSWTVAEGEGEGEGEEENDDDTEGRGCAASSVPAAAILLALLGRPWLSSFDHGDASAAATTPTAVQQR